MSQVLLFLSVAMLIHWNFISLKTDEYLMLLSDVEYTFSSFNNYIHNYNYFIIIRTLMVEVTQNFSFSIKSRQSSLCARKAIQQKTECIIYNIIKDG